MRHYLLPILTTSLVAGCVGNFEEKHHFASINRETGEVVNVFRLKVKGNAQFTNARYLAGFYDERAVDLFFNEVDSKPLVENAGNGASPFFGVVDCNGKTEEQCNDLREKELKVVPVGSDAGKTGAFVMMLSSDVDSIADTFGSFAESDVVVSSMMFMATKDEREEAAQVAAVEPISNKGRDATFATLKSLAGIKASTDDEQKQKWLTFLRSLAAELGNGSRPDFETVDEARVWFEARRTAGGGR